MLQKPINNSYKITSYNNSRNNNMLNNNMLNNSSNSFSNSNSSSNFNSSYSSYSSSHHQQQPRPQSQSPPLNGSVQAVGGQTILETRSVEAPMARQTVTVVVLLMMFL